jgi:putative colanic acid biosysnthesis UDP-glucose lipid carrier transferase
LNSQARVILETPLTDRIMALSAEPAIEDTCAVSKAALQQKTVSLGNIDPPLHALMKRWFKPALVVLSLGLCLLITSPRLHLSYLALALAPLLISHLMFSPSELFSPATLRRGYLRLPRTLLEWGGVVMFLLFLGFTLKLNDVFPHDLLLSWFLLTPVLLLIGDTVGARVAARGSAARRRYIIIGANEVGVELKRRASKYIGIGTFLGFFDFRSMERLPADARGEFAGLCEEVADFVRSAGVNAIYISLPMSNAPRFAEMLRELRDTTASIYFVPNIFAYDLVQARCVEINGMPILSICDTPFHGMIAVKKRLIDILLSSLALLLALPFMLLIALAIKLSSPGPVLFKQRRYGLHGQEIKVYKFRTMTVCEDGPVVEQARRQDQRTTRLGRILRRMSLDELPQLFNVLQGEMSFVGPRPHAVAHNELYRKLISGYMIRHKVRPGMTGWAQIHGLRGETRAVEQMRLRVEYDLEYLRNWSLALDLRIILKTVGSVLLHSRAY